MIFYEGPSLLDGKPIVGIVTGYNKKGSANAKTGRMLQTWILRSDVHPAVAAANGDDYSICGNCPHRSCPSTGRRRTCYVNVAYGPAAVYRAYQSGRYGRISVYLSDTFYGYALRLGSYGDPAAIPEDSWNVLVRHCSSRTGYTHQWTAPFAQWLRLYAMASCDSVTDYHDALGLGWKAFVVYNPNDHYTRRLLKLHKATPCPSSHEWIAAGKPKVSCEKCLKCDGTKASVMIAGHGSAKNRIGLAVVRS